MVEHRTYTRCVWGSNPNLAPLSLPSKSQSMPIKPLQSWIDTLFSLTTDESLIIRKTINGHLSITIRKQYNRDWSKSAEIVMTQEDIKRYGKAYVIEHVTKMIEELRN